MQEEYWNVQIQKHLDGVSSADEQRELEAWLAKKPAHQRQYEQLAAINKELSLLDFSANPNIENDWASLKAQLEDTSTQSTEPLKVVSIRRRPWLRIAASLLFLIASTWMLVQYFGTGNTSPSFAQEYSTSQGERKTVKLADGTNVELNGNSKLLISSDFNSKDRKVKLVGEAWFDVAKDKQRPFEIESNKVFAKVLGTAFNLRAYPNEEDVELSVKEGRVQFYSDQKEGLVFEAENAGSINRKSGKTIKIDYDPLLTNSWRNQLLVFDNIPFKTVLKVLEKRYDQKIIDQTGSFDEPFHSEFDVDIPIDQILEQFTVLYNLKIEKQNQQIIISK